MWYWSSMVPEMTSFCVKGFGTIWTRGTACVCAQHPRIGTFQGFLLKKETVVLSELVDFGPCFSAKTVKACAVIGLQIMAEENALRSDRDSSPDLGEMWKCDCPIWSDDGLEEERGEDTSSVEYYDHNVDNLAIEVVVGQNWWSKVNSLFLEDWVGGWAGGIELPLVNGPFVLRNEGCRQGKLRVSGFSSFLVFGEPKKLSGGSV